jgi:chorismate mutase
MQVKYILSFFRFIVWLLERAQATNERNFESTNATITGLIAKREAHATEIAKAKAAQRKLKDFVV